MSNRRLAARAPLACLAACIAPLLAVLTSSNQASAHPRPLPFTYTSDTLDDGELEVEQYADFVPVRALSSSQGTPVWYVASQFQTELEVGLGKRFELGLYVTYVPHPGESYTGAAQLTEGGGMKERIRYQFADSGEWPIDVGVYGEIVENEREIELEAKILLQRRIGALRIASNLWAEYELYFDGHRDVVLNPTLGFTYEVSRNVHLGLESWLRREYPHPAPSPRPFALGPHVYLGPTILLVTSRLWWSTGVYTRVTDTDHTIAPGESFGRLWVRSVIGFDL